MVANAATFSDSDAAAAPGKGFLDEFTLKVTARVLRSTLHTHLSFCVKIHRPRPSQEKGSAEKEENFNLTLFLGQRNDHLSMRKSNIWFLIIPVFLSLSIPEIKIQFQILIFLL